MKKPTTKDVIGLIIILAVVLIFMRWSYVNNFGQMRNTIDDFAASMKRTFTGKK